MKERSDIILFKYEDHLCCITYDVANEKCTELIKEAMKNTSAFISEYCTINNKLKIIEEQMDYIKNCDKYMKPKYKLYDENLVSKSYAETAIKSHKLIDLINNSILPNQWESSGEITLSFNDNRAMFSLMLR